MPKAKQSARPAESGWLLEVGVIGIVKTLTLLKLTKWTLLELEQVLRGWNRPDLDFNEKAKLPWLKLPPAPWEAPDGIDFGYYEDEAEHLFKYLEIDTHLRRGKGLSRGKGREKAIRPPLTRWLLDANTMRLFRSGPLDNDTERKKLERIKAHSLALGKALEVIPGRGVVRSKSYPEKIAEIVTYSRALPLIRKKYVGAQITKAEFLLKQHDDERRFLVVQLELLRDRWKNVGKLSG